MNRDLHHIFGGLRDNWRRSAGLTTLAVVAAVGALPHMWQVDPAALPGAVAEASKEVGELPVEVATGEAAGAGTAGKHLGFDTNVYPGDRTMKAWKDAGRYEWVGYYLPAPCHKDASWSGRRQRLTEMGWGMAVVYVGQQTWGRTPRPTSKAAQAAARRGHSCNADFVSADRGRVEGADAVAKAALDGFPTGTIIFLDIERMEAVPQAMRDYYRAWAATVLADGRYRVGVYVHKHNAALVNDDLLAQFAAAKSTETPTVWVASGTNFRTDAAPTDVGHAFANVWQGMLDVVETHAGIRLPIDVNVAAVPSPSERYATTTNVAD